MLFLLFKIAVSPSLRTVITIANGKDSITFKVLFLQSVFIYLDVTDYLNMYKKKKKAQRCLTRFSFVITKYRLFNMLFYDQLWYITSVFLFLWNNLTLFNEVMLKSTLVSIVLTLYHSKTGQSRFFFFHYYSNTCCNRNNGRVWICNRTDVTLNINEIETEQRKLIAHKLHSKQWLLEADILVHH